MKRLLILIITLFAIQTCFAQAVKDTIYVKARGIPGIYNLSLNATKDSLIFYVQEFRQALVLPQGGSSGDTISLSNRINLKKDANDSTDAIRGYTTLYQNSLKVSKVVADATYATLAAMSTKYTLPTLTNGSVLFYNGSDISQDNGNLFWDNINKRLGIGLTNPAFSFGVQKNQNAHTAITIANTTGGANSQAALYFTSDGGVQNTGQVFKNSSLTTVYKSLSANDFGFYNWTSGNISILNDYASGNINLTAGGASASQFILNPNGNINILNLKTGSSAPTPTGTTKLLISDANGLLSNVTAIPNGTTATTQATTDSSNLLATTAFVKQVPIKASQITGVIPIANLQQKTIGTRYPLIAVNDTTLGISQTYLDSIFASGVYTPTLTGVTNYTSSIVRTAQWSKVGKTVTVSGEVLLQATATGLTTVSLTLPVASTFGSSYDAAGTGAGIGFGTMYNYVVVGRSGTQTVAISFIADTNATTGQVDCVYNYTYQIE